MIDITATQKTNINNDEVVYFGKDPQNKPLEVLVFKAEKKPNSNVLQKKF
jgi:hypothetical protein